jgi:hypothetical protein
MPYQVTGTRELTYRVGTADEVAGWVADELDTMSQGWVPLTSERCRDGSLRVVYGRLPDEATDLEPAMRPVPAGRGIRADVVRAFATLVALCTILIVAIAGVTFLATPI